MSSRQSIRLFRLFGIDVFLHWSWFLVAVYQIQSRQDTYSSPVWSVVEYLGLFAMVLMHEFGHALACRQVGGSSSEILLWPLGGVAYVNPPARPGALLWSIAAGPLVNVALIPVFKLLLMGGNSFGWFEAAPAVHQLVWRLGFINLVLLGFNLLPIYPLDGGQILRALLWYVLGRARSLTAASVVGVLGCVCLIALAVSKQSIWIGILAFFGLQRCWIGFKEAKALARLEKAPKHDNFACPSCHANPPRAALWLCPGCKTPFDTFESDAFCPTCGNQFAITTCPACHQPHSITEWAEDARRR